MSHTHFHGPAASKDAIGSQPVTIGTLVRSAITASELTMGGVHEPNMAMAPSWLINVWTLDAAVSVLEASSRITSLTLCFLPSIVMPPRALTWLTARS